MAQFNFNIMDSAGYGFYRVWQERAYLMKLAMIPLFIKFACMIAVMVLGVESNMLRQGLILFPGILAEGWVLAQFLRTLLRNERWPTVLPADIDEKLLDRLLLRARGIVAATLAYGLVALASYMLRYLAFGVVLGDFESSGEDVARLLDGGVDTKEKDAPPVGTEMFVPMIFAMIALVWAFRLMWIYIPFSVLMPFKDYMKALGGMMASVKMLALFFCTLTPIMFVTVMISRLFFNIGDSTGEIGQDIARFVMIFVAVVAEMLVALVSTTAFVWVMRDFLPRNSDLLKEMPKLGDDK